MGSVGNGEENEFSRIKIGEKIYEIPTSLSLSDSFSFLRSYPPIKLKDVQKNSYKNFFF